MARQSLRCSICSSDRRSALEEVLAKGASVRRAATQFGFSSAAVDRHRRLCPSQRAEIVSPGTSQAGLRRLYGALQRVLRRAERKGDHRAALECIGKMQELEKQTVSAENLRPGKKEILIRVITDPPSPAVQSRMDCQRVLAWLRQFIVASENKGTRTELLAISAARLVSGLSTRPFPANLAEVLDIAEREAQTAIEAELAQQQGGTDVV